jgi:hypothetical protein
MRSFQNFVVFFFFVFAFVGIGEVLGQNRVSGLVSGNTYAPAISQYVPPSDPNIAFDLYNARLDREEQAKKDKLLLEIYTAYQDLEKQYATLLREYNSLYGKHNVLIYKYEQALYKLSTSEDGEELLEASTTDNNEESVLKQRVFLLTPIYEKPTTNSLTIKEVDIEECESVVVLERIDANFVRVKVGNTIGYILVDSIIKD